MISLSGLSAAAQGLVNFNNTAATLFSAGPAGPPINAVPGSFYFALLTAPLGATDPGQFSFSGIYATNTSVPGRFFGGSGVEVPGWLAGDTRSFRVAGWSASLGLTWDPAWLNGLFDSGGFWGLSGIGTGSPGGAYAGGPPLIPPLILFGGATGIRGGFNFYPVPVPEPATVPLLLIGVIGFGILARHRKRTDVRVATLNECSQATHQD